MRVYWARLGRESFAGGGWRGKGFLLGEEIGIRREGSGGSGGRGREGGRTGVGV